MNVVEDKAHFQNALPLYSSLEGGQLKSHTEPLPSYEKRGLLSLIGARIYSEAVSQVALWKPVIKPQM